MTNPTPRPDAADRWLEAPVVGHAPVRSVVLRIAAEPGPERPLVTRYLIGEMVAGPAPCGVDYPVSVEEEEAIAKLAATLPGDEDPLNA